MTLQWKAIPYSDEVAPVGHIHNYVHTQMVPSDTWTINHDLNKKPSVTIIDSAGSWVMGDIEYPSDSQVILRFSHPFDGTATLN